MYLQRSLIHEQMSYYLEMAHNSAESIRNICYVKCEGTIDHNIFNGRSHLEKLKTLSYMDTLGETAFVFEEYSSVFTDELIFWSKYLWIFFVTWLRIKSSLVNT